MLAASANEHQRALMISTVNNCSLVSDNSDVLAERFSKEYIHITLKVVYPIVSASVQTMQAACIVSRCLLPASCSDVFEKLLHCSIWGGAEATAHDLRPRGRSLAYHILSKSTSGSRRSVHLALRENAA